jgi:hypothetical protein
VLVATLGAAGPKQVCADPKNTLAPVLEPETGNAPLRPALLLTAGLLIVATALIAAIYFWSPHANLRVTVGPPGSPAYRFVTAFAAVPEANHPRVRV